MGTFQLITKFRRLKDVVFLRPDLSPPQDGDIATYVLADDKMYLAAPAAGGGGGTDDQTAAEVPFTPAGNLAATNVQTALEELDTEKAAAASAVMDGDAAGGVLSGAFPNPSFAADMATQVELDAVAAAKQDADSDLAAIAALAPTNDDVIQRKAGAWTNRTLAQLIADLAALGTTFQPKDTTLDTYAGIDPSANVQSILGAADFAAIRTLLGLVVGTDVQAHDADLDTWAGLTPSAFFQTLVDDADAATARATLGVIASLFQNGGTEELSVSGLSGELADAQPVTVRKNTGVDVGTRSRLNFIEGTNVTLSIADDAGSDEIDVTIAATGGGGGGTRQAAVTLTNPGIAAPSTWTVLSLTDWDAGHWEFPKNVDGKVYGIVKVPPDYSSGGALKLSIAANATTGDTRLGVATKAVADGESLNPTLTDETKQDITVPGTAYLRKVVSFTLTETLAAGDLLLVEIFHEGSHVNDTLDANTLLFGAWLEYTAA